MTLALEGIRIVDLTWLGPGILCSTTLGDLGADVIEVYEAHPERRGAPYTMLYDSTRLMARCMILELDHPTLDRIKQVDSMHKLLGSPVEARNWSTRFGQYTDEILRELDYDDTRIKELREADAVG
jgi:crotonobetainyl-CoA:carnitine CoA-transferase CaiB-like acyl-CoA transferase